MLIARVRNKCDIDINESLVWIAELFQTNTENLNLVIDITEGTYSRIFGINTDISIDKINELTLYDIDKERLEQLLRLMNFQINDSQSEENWVSMNKSFIKESKILDEAQKEDI